jgi:hypothetical protein
VVFDLKALNVPPGDYCVSFLGGGVVKYRHQPELVTTSEAASKKMQLEVKALEAEVKKLAGDAQSAPAERQQMTKALAVNARMKAATDALNVRQQQLEKAKATAQPRDIADIVVCEPFTIRVLPVEKK